MTAETNRTWLAICITLIALIGFDIMGMLVRVLAARGYGVAELSAYRNVLGVIPSIIALI